MIRFILFPIAHIRLVFTWNALCAEQGIDPNTIGPELDYTTPAAKRHKSAYIKYLWTLDEELYRKYMATEYHRY